MSGALLPWLETQRGPHEHQRRALADLDDEHLAKAVRRRRERPDGMPRMLAAHEEQAAVSQRRRRDLAVEILDLRRRAGRVAAAVVEDQRVAAPGRVPILFGVEVEDVRRELLCCY